MMQSLPSLDLLGLGGRQGGTHIQTYHTINIIFTMQQANVVTSILKLDLWCKACPLWICWALELDKEDHPHKHIILGTNIICTKHQSHLFTSILRLDWDCKAAPLGFTGPWRYARSEINTNISHYKYNMYHAIIKFVYKYSEARLRLQSLSPLDVLGIGGKQGGTSI